MVNDPLSDSREAFEKIAKRLLSTEVDDKIKFLTDELMKAYELGIVMGAAAELAHQRRKQGQAAWE